MQQRTGQWIGPAVRLDRALAELGLARSRSQATELIADGKVRLDDTVTRKSGTKVPSHATLTVDGVDHYVSRAAHKLLTGLTQFDVSASDCLALDLGASTGGFTQVLLERGAKTVLAVDVGHDQLAPELREESRVHLVEGCNARDLTSESLADLTGVAEAPSLIVGDLSFISLTLILPAIARVAASQADVIVLIKPQFEVGRSGIREGIVVDPSLADAAVERVLACAADLGLKHRGLIPSPITGEHGNQEFLAYFERMEE